MGLFNKEDPPILLFSLVGLEFYAKQLNESEIEFYSVENDEKRASRIANYDYYDCTISHIQLDGCDNDVQLRVKLSNGEIYTYNQHDIVSILYWEKKQPVEEDGGKFIDGYYMPNYKFDNKYIEKYLKHNKPKEDIVNHPSHYQSNQGIEVIQVIGAFTEDLVGMEAVCTANVLKYVCRWKKKNGIEDLKKAEWYLKKLIDIKEAESK